MSPCHVKPPPHSAPSAGTLPEQRSARTVVVAGQDTLCVVDAAGRPLLSILATESGPVIQLASHDLVLGVGGQLRIQANSIELIAADGDLKLLAKDDVVARGEKIRLN